MLLTDFVEEFFVGITHDRNMSRMAKFFEEHQNLKDSLKENDLFARIAASNSQTFKEFYKQRIPEENLVHPIFSNYKMVSLD